MDAPNSTTMPVTTDAVLNDRRDELCAKVTACVAEVVGADPARVLPSTQLLDLGAQSFDFVDIVFRLESTFGIDMPRKYLVPDNRSVEELIRAVAEQLALQPRV